MTLLSVHHHEETLYCSNNTEVQNLPSPPPRFINASKRQRAQSPQAQNCPATASHSVRSTQKGSELSRHFYPATVAQVLSTIQVSISTIPLPSAPHYTAHSATVQKPFVPFFFFLFFFSPCCILAVLRPAPFARLNVSLAPPTGLR